MSIGSSPAGGGAFRHVPSSAPQVPVESSPTKQQETTTRTRVNIKKPVRGGDGKLNHTTRSHLDASKVEDSVKKAKITSGAGKSSSNQRPKEDSPEEGSPEALYQKNMAAELHRRSTGNLFDMS